MTNEQKNRLTLQLLDQYPQLTSAAFGYRKVNGSYVDNELVIVLSVSEKRKLSEINKEDVLPSEITFEGFTFSTDIIELEDQFLDVAGFPTGSLNGSGDFAVDGGFAPNLPTTLANPVIGGIRINNSASTLDKDPSATGFGVGTLGTLAVDNTSGALVGLTNAHVVGVDDDFVVDGTNTDLNQITDFPIRIDAVSSDGTNGSNIVGRVWRISPRLVESLGNNNIDAAVIALRDGVFAANTSIQQLNLPGFNTTFASSTPEWATSDELNGILSTDPMVPLVVTRDVYHSGARTGAKGEGNPRLRITATNNVVRIATAKGTGRFVNTIRVEAFDNTDSAFTDGSAPWGTPCQGVSNSGDSGSAIHAEIETSPGVFEIKLIGLLFAGPASSDRSSLTMCRIDHIANEMNVSRWDGTATTSVINSTGVGNQISIIRSGEHNDATFDHPITGVTYYRSGLTTDNATI